MEEVVSAARRIERILQERPTSGMELLIESMQSQIQTLTKDLAKAHEPIAAKPQAATPIAAFAAPSSNTVAAAQPPPATLAPPKLPNPAATPLPPLATAQPPPYSKGLPPYFEYGEEVAPYFRGQRRQSERRPLRCFLCDEEGHFPYRCLPELCRSACCSNRRRNMPEGHPGNKSWQGRLSPRWPRLGVGSTHPSPAS